MRLTNGKRLARAEIPTYCEFPAATRRRARQVLRQELKRCPELDSSALAADVIVEQVWNAVTGLDKPENAKSKRR